MSLFFRNTFQGNFCLSGMIEIFLNTVGFETWPLGALSRACICLLNSQLCDDPQWEWARLVLKGCVCVCVCVCMLSCVQLFCDPVACSPPVSFVYGIFQARILEWVAISFSRGYSRPRDWTCVSCSGRWRLYQRHQGSPSSEGEWAVNDKTTLSLLCYLQPPKHRSWFTVSLRG